MNTQELLTPPTQIEIATLIVFLGLQEGAEVFQRIARRLAFHYDLLQPKVTEKEQQQPENECMGYGRGGQKECCPRMGEYNGYGSGPTIFTCPKHCGCHD